MALGVYYSVLDSVNFSTERPRQDLEQVRISAAGSLMLGLLVGKTRPVLSDAQVFDNTLIMDTVASFDREAEAFLGLIRDGHLHVRILATPGLEVSASQHVTLLDAFVAALQRPAFVFSAWPELRNSEIRQAVLSLLAGNADPDRELDDKQLAQRIMAIRELSGSFESRAENNSLRMVRRPVFSEQFVRLLENLRTKPEVRGAAEWLLQSMVEQSGTLEYRSTWYRLIASIPESELGTMNRPPLLDGVNGIYNEEMARALNCDPDISFADRRIARAAVEAGLRGQWGQRAVGVAEVQAVRDIMSWDMVRNTLPHLEVFATPQARLTYLISEFSNSIGRERVENHTVTWLRVRAPRRVLGKLAALGTTEVGLSFSTALGGSHLAEAIGGLVGIVAVFAGAPAINRVVAARDRRIATREAMRVRRTLTRNSSAWLQQIDEG